MSIAAVMDHLSHGLLAAVLGSLLFGWTLLGGDGGDGDAGGDCGGD